MASVIGDGKESVPIKEISAGSVASSTSTDSGAGVSFEMQYVPPRVTVAINSFDDAERYLSILENLKSKRSISVEDVQFLSKLPNIPKTDIVPRSALQSAVQDQLKEFIVQKDKGADHTNDKQLVHLSQRFASHLTLVEKKGLLERVQSTTLVPTFIDITAQHLLKNERSFWKFEGAKQWKDFGNIKKYKNDEVKIALVEKAKAFLTSEAPTDADKKETAVRAVVKIAQTGLFDHPELAAYRTDLETKYGSDMKLLIKHEQLSSKRKVSTTGFFVMGYLSFGIITLPVTIPSMALWLMTVGVCTPGIMTSKMRDLKKDFVEVMNAKKENDPISVTELRVYAHLKAGSFMFEDVWGLDEKVKGRLETALEGNEKVQKERVSINTLKWANRGLALLGTLVIGGVVAVHA